MAGLALARRARQVLILSVLAGAVGSLGGVLYFRYLCWKRLYVRRVARFIWHLGPIILHYHWVERNSRSDEERERRVKALHVRYAPVVSRTLGELRGMYTKVAQMASMVPGATFLPEEYKKEFQKLQNDTSPAAWLAVRSVIEEDLGAPLGQLFQRFEREPIGCASLGQAHLATWRGRSIVVKVQFPEARANLMADFDCLEYSARSRDPSGSAVRMTQMCRRQFEKELDYLQEATHLRGIRDAVNAAPEFCGRVLVPEPIPELTRGRIIAMEYVPGPKMADVFIARLRALGLDALANTLKGVMDLDGGTGPGAGPGGGPSGSGEEAAEEEEEARITQAPAAPPGHRFFGRLSKVLGPRVTMTLLGVLAELKLRCLRCRGRLAPGSTTRELRARMHFLLHLQGFQFFFCPFFHGDPHPGNFIAVPDGRVGMIDFGQCIKIDPQVKLGFARLILALNLPESPESSALIYEILTKNMGVQSAKGDVEYLAFMTRLLLTSFKPHWGQNSYMERMQARDAVVYQPLEVFFITRVASLLRGFGLFVAENVDVARAWAPWAERWLRENGELPTPAAEPASS